MSTFRTVLGSQLKNVARSRWLLAYTVTLFGIAGLLLRFGGSGERALLSLLNVVLLLLPLVAAVFGTLYLYNAREFIELLLAQPVGRSALYLGLFGGLAGPLSAAFVLGVGTPLAVQAGREPAILGPLAMLLVVGVFLTLVFTAFAFWVAVRVEDRAWGLGAVLLAWLGCTVLYDGVILLVLTVFRAYPLEGPVLVLTLLNPVDLGRVLLLLTFDVAALMGYTGTIYARAFGSVLGVAGALTMLVLCTLVPLSLGMRRFRRKDF
jgi:Cu-processing system permease protein